jgi:uncharacterized membrane protein
MYNIFVHQSSGRVRQITRVERAGFAAIRAGGREIVCFAGKILHKIAVLKYIYLISSKRFAKFSTVYSKSMTFGCVYLIFKEFSYSCLSLGQPRPQGLLRTMAREK